MTSNNESNNGMVAPSPTATSPDIAAASSGCPVLIRRDASSSTTNEAEASGRFWNRWFARSSSETNNNNTNVPNIPSNSSISECPVKRSDVSECPVKGNASLPASIEEAANHSQFPLPGQKIPLSTQRVISSIPRGDATDSAPNNSTITTTTTITDHTRTTIDNSTPKVPAHQPSDSPHWTYPSEQQFYNAMRKKGYQPPIETIPFVLKIHNSVNERSWLQVCKWEKELHGNDNPKLVKFVGRPKDLSPKAWWNSRVWMTQEPFDRHDWYVEDNEGEGKEPRRYVIDFYEGKENSGAGAGRDGLLGSAAQGNAGVNAGGEGGVPPVARPPSMYIDVRPALDTPSAAADRIAMAMREALPGITAAWDSYKMSSPSSTNNNTIAGADSCAGGNCEGKKTEGCNK